MERTRDLYHQVRRSLLNCGVYEDDADWMGGLIARELDEAFELRPKQGRIHHRLLDDLHLIAEELADMQGRSSEDVAAYLYERLTEKYSFSVRLRWIIDQKMGGSGAQNT